MSDAFRQTKWSWEEYLAWEVRQPIRYELAGGQVHAKGGGTTKHDTIGNNLRRHLWSCLRGTPCRVQGPDLKVKAGQDGRYPDALIDRGPRVPDALQAQTPVAVFEILSKTTAWIDQTRKLREFDATPSVLTYILISQDEPRALVYRRDEIGRLSIRSAALLERPESAIEIAEPELSVPFSALHEDVEFNPGTT